MSCALGIEPKSDNKYFERMSKVIVSIGLSRVVVEKKWPVFKEAFYNFNISKVSKIEEFEIEEMMKNEELIRNYSKLSAIVKNSTMFIEIKKEHGSFRKFISHFDARSEEELRKQVSKRFNFLGPSTVVYFLRAVGVELPETMKKSQFKTGGKNVKNILNR